MAPSTELERTRIFGQIAEPHHHHDATAAASDEDKSLEGGEKQFTEKHASGYHPDHVEERLEQIDGGNSEHGMVKRDLKQRHIVMIALGGAIGTGLFIGLGQSLRGSGPLSALLGYSIMGLLVWSLMISLGELCAFLPVAGGFVHHASRFVEPAMGSAVAWSYWFSYGITLPTEISAAALIVGFWDPNQTINPAAWVTIFMVLCVSINFMPVRFYGEIEFWLASLKVIVVVMLIIVMLVIDVGGSPTGDYIGGRYWRMPGPMAQLFWEPDAQNNPVGGISGAWGRFLAFWNVLVGASFAFAGTEIIGVTVGEVANPRNAVPKAIRNVALRIIIFYVLAVLMVGLVVPYNDPKLLNADTSNASASPYVIAIENARINVLPSFINAVLLTVTWSAGQSDLYASTRTLYGLALEGQAPKIFKKCLKNGVPIWATAATALYAPLAYMVCGAIGANKAFTYLYNVSAVSILIVWWAIMLTYIRFYHGMRAQRIDRKEALPYRAPLQPYLSYFTFFMFSVIILLSAFTVFINGQWDTSTFVTNYICIPLFVIIYVGYKLWTKSKVVSLQDMDFMTGRRALDLLDQEEEVPEYEKSGLSAKLHKAVGWVL